MAHAPYRDTAPEIEQRTTPVPVELRAATGGNGRTITGYGAVFGCRSELLGSFHEVVDSRAFNKSSGDGYPDVTARWNHKDELLLGTVASGSLRLAIDDRGLLYDCDLPASRADLAELIERRDITQSSFSFECWSDRWGFDDGVPLRTLESVRLRDVAPVSQAAYRSTSVAMRSLAAYVGAPLADVQRYAESDRLAEFFTRSDRRSAPMSPRQRQLQVMAKRYPDTPVSMRARQRQLELLAKRWPAEPSKPLTGHQAVVATLAKRFPPH